jgi:cytochrome c5
VGLRLFPRATDPNPEVRKEWERSRHKWDPDRYISDESYYKDPTLVRPYRVGMSCGFCHISANPMNPPKEMHKAKWSNLSSNIGAQYFWFGRTFGTDFKRDNLLYYLLNYAEPGTLDTSLVATDGNNNPNTMNSVYQLLPRIVASLNSPKERTPPETLQYMPRLDQGYLVPKGRSAGTIVDADTKGPNDVRPLRFTEEEQPFLKYLGLPDHPISKKPDRLPLLGDATSRHTPKVLVDGADGIGGRGALCRVYLNIGEYGQEWRQLHNTMVGITPQRPFKMSRAAVDSVNWNVTMRRSTNLAKYFLAGSVPMRLQDAPGIDKLVHPKSKHKEKANTVAATETASVPGAAPPTEAAPEAERVYDSYVLANDHPDVISGAKIFARDCFVCHSSLGQPDGFWDDAANWKKWIQQPDYVDTASKWLVGLLKEKVTTLEDKHKDKYIANDPFFEGFVKENYLSTDARYHVSDIGTNTGRALADNGSSDERMWANYSSIDFKMQSRVASPIEIAHPYDKETTITWPLNTEAGPGRFRPHSLSSMWAHGPYLHNNSVGFYPFDFGPDPRPGQEGQVLATLSPGIQSVKTRVTIFEDGTRRLLGLESEPQGYDDAKDYRGFSHKPRRGFDSIVRFQDTAAIELPAVIVPDLIYMQSLALIGFGIPRWVLILLLLGLLVVAIVLFVKGGRRIHEGRGSLLRNVAAIAIGILLVGTLFSLWQKESYRVGYIPKGTPVNLVANLNGPKWITSSPKRKKLLPLALIGLLKAEKYKVSSLEEVTVHERPLIDILMELSKCPDLVLDKGHEFGEYDTLELAKGRRVKVPEADREALIEFLKKL